MWQKKTFLHDWCAFTISLIFITGMAWAEERISPFPSYGSGPITVRLYSDYFCPPCREMEPDVEPILRELLKKNAIRLTLVDVPNRQLSPLYGRNFLYAIRESKDLEHAFRVRNVLQNAATGKNFMKTQEQIEALFKEKRIAYGVWNTKPAFDRYNDLIKEDKINGTPTCVVIKNGQREVFLYPQDIIKALRALP